jgi:hypothetical protein
VRATQATLWGAVMCAAALGCATLTPTTGRDESVVQADADVEITIPTDETWRALAANMPFGNVAGHDDDERRWAAPNYGTRDWLPAISHAGPAAEGEQFEGSRWLWYPEREFVFGGANSIPNTRRVVHLRREFHAPHGADQLTDAYVDVMTSGSIAIEVFVNGDAVKAREQDGEVAVGALQGDERMRHATPRRYFLGEHVREGANAIGIQATATVGADEDGASVPNYVRDGVIAMIVVR